MGKNRLESFSDGVIAILITIMVLELKIPQGNKGNDLIPLFPHLITYVLSFLFIAIYWNNHHLLFLTISKINNKIVWANVDLLFWLSLIPFVTGWMGENYSASVPVAIYGVVFLLTAIAYYILQRLIVLSEGPKSKLALAAGNNLKGTISLILYFLAIPIAFIRPWISEIIYGIVAIIWLIPSKEISEITLAT